MLKYIIALIVVIAAWVVWGVFLDADLIIVPVGITALTITVLVAIIVLRKLRARRAARELEKALAQQAAEQARTARPDLQGEIMQMQQEFQRAISALKSSKLARGGENALYALPWHLIIGPPGSGKSTALRNSGLQFPYAGSSGGGVRGIGGTRNCDWWLTNEGVLLDTAGRWTTEDEDRDEWTAFLDLIRKFRPEKPLNGIVVAISLGDIGGAHDEEVAALAKRTRERIDEVQNRLQMSLPVYVLFTKADLVPGFVETFGDLSKQERGQVWGFTVPIATPPADPGGHFAERFDELNGIIERRSLRRMGEERKIESRELIHSFPQQFGVLRKSCTDFVSRVFEPSVYGQTPMMRGCYFSSGTQEGRPIDRVMHKMAEAFGIRSEVNLGEPVTEAKSYFLRDVFLDVVFPDRDVAVRSEAEQRRQRRQRYIIAAAMFGVAVLASILPAIAWANNRTFLEETREVVDAAAASSSDEGPLSPEQLRPLRERAELLRRHQTRGAPVLMRIGMYRDDVYEPVRDLYTTMLRERVVRPIVDADAQAMDDFGRRYEALRDSIPTGPEHSGMYDRLKLHLLVTRPVSEGEPPLSQGDVAEWVAARIERRWVDAAGGEEQIEESTQQEIRQNAQFFTELMAAEDELRFPRDDETVQRVRLALTRVSLTDMALERIIQEVEPLGLELRLDNLIGNTVRPMRSDALVQGAFTRRGWDQRVQDMLSSSDSPIFGEPWVLGREFETSQRTQAQRDEDLRILRNQYFRRYVEVWRDFLRAIVVTRARENVPTLTGLQDLTRGDPEPYRRLFQQVLYNTMLPNPEGESESSGASDAAGATAWDVFWRRVRRVRGGATAERVLRGALGSGSVEEGEDREELTPEHVFLAFEGFTRFGAVPPPEVPEGQEPPPPPDLPIGAYEEQLATVRDALQAHLDTPQGTDEALMTGLATARTTTRALIEAQEIGWRPRFEALLWPPIDGAAMSTAMAQAGAAGRSWCTEVYSPYHRNLLGGYPMAPSGHDVPLDDFAAFYAPETGTLWAFYEEVLKRRIPREGDQFVFATNLGQQASNAYRRQLLQYLQRAHDISSTFFSPGSDEPRVQYDVRIRPSVRVATQTFCAGGQCNEYHNGPERWTRFTWPGEDPVAGASIELRGADGIHERLEQAGEWGLFRLLEQGTVTSTSRDRRIFTMTWRIRSHDVDVSIDFRPVRGDAPFFGVAGRERNPPLLQPLRAREGDPPRQISAGRSTCNIR